MKIIRDGKEYELTTNELFLAWQEHERKCDTEDMHEWLDDWCEDNAYPRDTVTKEQEDEILESFEDLCMGYDVWGLLNERRRELMNDAIAEILEGLDE